MSKWEGRVSSDCCIIHCVVQSFIAFDQQNFPTEVLKFILQKDIN